LTFLLDVNVLIALVDPAHIAHEEVHMWFGAEPALSWATCPITENGLIRIVSNPRYPNTPGPPSVVADILKKLCQLDGHVFWPDDLSITNAAAFKPSELHHPGQVTDSYLLALAVARGGKLATLDRRLVTAAVAGGKEAVVWIE
jgi:toxin-antitoxin system PIN domain toxin